MLQRSVPEQVERVEQLKGVEQLERVEWKCTARQDGHYQSSCRPNVDLVKFCDEQQLLSSRVHWVLVFVQ